MPHHDPLEFPDESTPVSRLRREVEVNSGYNEPTAPAGEKLFAADILAVCSSVERLEAENKRLRAALGQIGWGGESTITVLPGPNGVLSREDMQEIARAVLRRKEA